MQIRVNNETMTLENSLTVQALLDMLQLDMRKIAVERNLEIVPRSSFEAIMLHEGDQVEIIHFIGGG